MRVLLRFLVGFGGVSLIFGLIAGMAWLIATHPLWAVGILLVCLAVPFFEMVYELGQDIIG